MIALFEKLFPSHNFRWDKKGQNAKGCCPFHADRRPSMQIYLDGNGKVRWYCFSEKIGGKEIDAVRRTEHGPTYEAANRWLIKNGFLQETEQDAKVRKENEVLEKFYRWSHELLVSSDKALEMRKYLEKRGVSQAVVAQAPIGFYPGKEAIDEWAALNALTEEDLELFIPESKTADARIKGGIIFFYRTTFDLWGRPKVRNPLRESTDKVTMWLGKKNSKKQSGFFSGSTSCPETSHAILVEGEIDVLALQAVCLASDVDCPEPIYSFGSGANIEDGVNLLTKAGVERLYLFPDNDTVGIDYAFTVAENYTQTFILYPDDYGVDEDPAEWSMRHVFTDLQLVYKERIPAFEWVGRRLAKAYQQETPESQAKAKDKVLEYARKLSPTNRELFLKTYAPLTGVTYESLWEEIQSRDTNIRYRKIFDEDAYGIHMSTPTSNKKNPEYEHISNVIIEFEKDVILDDGSGEEDPDSKRDFGGGIDVGRQERSLILRIMLPHKEKRIKVTAADFADDRTFYNILLREIGSTLWIKPKYMCFVKEAAVLTQRNLPPKPEEVIFTHTGWRDGKFLMPNGFVDIRGFQSLGEVKVELPKNPQMFSRYGLAEAPVSLDEIKKSLRDDILQVFPYSVTLPLLAHMFLAPVLGMIPNSKPYCMWIQGLTGSFKTTYTCLLASLFGDFVRGDAIETFRSTGNALEKAGYYLKDCVYIVDDYKKVDIQDKYVVSLLQNYGDMHGRGRLKADQTQQKTWHIRGLLTVTGEDLVSGEASAIARTIIVPIRSVGDTEKLTRGQSMAKHLPGLMTKYIQFLLENKDKISDWSTYTTIAHESTKFSVTHKRIKMNLALNEFAWNLAAEFLGLQDLTPQYLAAMEEIARYMEVTTAAEQAGASFIELTREVLSSGDFYLEGIKGAKCTPHIDSAKRIGFVAEEAVYLSGTHTLAAVNALRNKLYGKGLAYSQNAIYEQLAGDGLIERSSNGKLTTVLKVAGQSHRVLKLMRGVVDDVEDFDTGAEFNGSEIRVKGE